MYRMMSNDMTKYDLSAQTHCCGRRSVKPRNIQHVEKGDGF
jgi:hypothetical protein